MNEADITNNKIKALNAAIRNKMKIVVTIEKEVADKLLRIVKAESTQDAVNKVIGQYIKGK